MTCRSQTKWAAFPECHQLACHDEVSSEHASSISDWIVCKLAAWPATRPLQSYVVKNCVLYYNLAKACIPIRAMFWCKNSHANAYASSLWWNEDISMIIRWVLILGLHGFWPFFVLSAIQLALFCRLITIAMHVGAMKFLHSYGISEVEV